MRQVVLAASSLVLGYAALPSPAHGTPVGPGGDSPLRWPPAARLVTDTGAIVFGAAAPASLDIARQLSHAGQAGYRDLILQQGTERSMAGAGDRCAPHANPNVPPHADQHRTSLPGPAYPPIHLALDFRHQPASGTNAAPMFVYRTTGTVKPGPAPGASAPPAPAQPAATGMFSYASASRPGTAADRQQRGQAAAPASKDAQKDGQAPAPCITSGGLDAAFAAARLTVATIGDASSEFSLSFGSLHPLPPPATHPEGRAATARTNRVAVQFVARASGRTRAQLQPPDDTATPRAPMGIAIFAGSAIATPEPVSLSLVAWAMLGLAVTLRGRRAGSDAIGHDAAPDPACRSSPS